MYHRYYCTADCVDGELALVEGETEWDGRLEIFLVGDGALSVVMDGPKSTVRLSVMTLDMISLVYTHK